MKHEQLSVNLDIPDTMPFRDRVGLEKDPSQHIALHYVEQD